MLFRTLWAKMNIIKHKYLQKYHIHQYIANFNGEINMTRIHLSDKSATLNTQIFIPNKAEIDYINFLNLLPVASYQCVPDQNILILDFEILNEYLENNLCETETIKIIYNSKEYSFNEFIRLFDVEKTFYVNLN